MLGRNKKAKPPQTKTDIINAAMGKRPSVIPENLTMPITNYNPPADKTAGVGDMKDWQEELEL